jgi:hypothetical protein
MRFIPVLLILIQFTLQKKFNRKIIQNTFNDSLIKSVTITLKTNKDQDSFLSSQQQSYTKVQIIGS